MRLGIDIDGCMYQWDRTARYLLRDEFGYPKDGPLGQQSQYWDYIKAHVEPAHWNWLWTGGVKAGLFRHGHLYKGTMRTLRALADDGHDLVVITHRPASAVNDTLEWLAFLRLPLAGVHILTNQEPKSEIPCDIYIDDKPGNITDYLLNTSDVAVLMDRPWNQGYFAADAPRVGTWEEFAGIIRRLK